jgi:poly(beta-D-mannuronate) lyase
MNLTVGWKNWPATLAAFGLVVTSAGAATLRVTTTAEIAAAALRAQPGDEIVLADGEYRDVTLKLAQAGRPGQPIMLRAEHDRGAVLTGSPGIEVAGDHVEVRGLAFKDCVFKAGTRGALNFNGPGHSRATECSFEHATLPGGVALVNFRNGAHDNRLDHCRFVATRYRSVVVVVDDNSLMDCTVAPYHNRIANNTVTGKAGQLIKATDAPNNTIENNTLNERP